jgi:hypothetical protein
VKLGVRLVHGDSRVRYGIANHRSIHSNVENVVADPSCSNSPFIIYISVNCARYW